MNAEYVMEIIQVVKIVMVFQTVMPLRIIVGPVITTLQTIVLKIAMKSGVAQRI